MIDDKVDLNVILLIVIIFLLLSKDAIEKFTLQTSCWIRSNGMCKLNVDPNSATMCHNIVAAKAPQECISRGCPSGMDEGGSGRLIRPEIRNKKGEVTQTAMYDGNKGFCRPSQKNLMIQGKDELESGRGRKIFQLCTTLKGPDGEPMHNNTNSIGKCARKLYRRITGAPEFSYCDGSSDNKCTFSSCYSNTTGKSLDKLGVAKDPKTERILQGIKLEKDKPVNGACGATDTIPTALRELSKGTVGTCIEGDIGMCSTVDEMVKNTDDRLEMLNKKIKENPTPELLAELQGATKTKVLVDWFKENEYSKLKKTGAIDLTELNIKKEINGTDAKSRCFDLTRKAKKLDKDFNGDPRSEKLGKYALQKCINETGDLMAFNQMTRSRQQNFNAVGQNITNTSAYAESNIPGFDNTKLTATQLRLQDLQNMGKCMKKDGSWDSINKVCSDKDNKPIKMD